MRKQRTMPIEGFYVYLVMDIMYKDDPNRIRVTSPGRIIYTNGLRNKTQGGIHKYWYPGCGNQEDISTWALLQWNCVPGIKDLQDNFIYAATLEKAIEIYNRLHRRVIGDQ